MAKKAFLTSIFLTFFHPHNEPILGTFSFGFVIFLQKPTGFVVNNLSIEHKSPTPYFVFIGVSIVTPSLPDIAHS
jgi:hypothetical protein